MTPAVVTNGEVAVVDGGKAWRKSFDNWATAARAWVWITLSLVI